MDADDTPALQRAVVASGAAAVHPLREGTRVGPYEVLGRVGAGGMGVVYRARDTRLGREVALKFLTETRLDARSRSRFDREARLASAVSHPHVVALHDVGEHEGVPYLVTELLEGASLRELISAGPVPWQQAVALTEQVAAGLAAAHARGIVHRDLKPENLFLTHAGSVKILDFGVARLEEPASHGHGSTTDVSLTASGTAVGTPAYMSPEQLRMEAVDARSDLFSLGCVLYELLIGRRPFAATTGVDLAFAICHHEPAPLPPQLPPRVAAVVLRCLQKDRGDRVQSAHDLAQLLRALNGSAGETEVVSSTVTLERGAAPAAASTPPREETPPHPAAVGPAGSPVAALGQHPSQWRWAWLALAAVAAFAAAALAPRLLRRAPLPAERIKVATADVINETGDPQLDSLSGLLITSLEESSHLAVLTRSRMFDILRLLGKGEATRIDEPLGREISKQAGASALIIATVRRFGETYSLDLKALDPAGSEYLFTAREQGAGKESIPGQIDRLSERARLALRESAAEVRAASAPVATLATANFEAYQHYFRADELIGRGQFGEAIAEYRRAADADPRFALPRLWLGIWAADAGGGTYAPLEQALALGLPERERCFAQAWLQPDGDVDRIAGKLDACIARYPGHKTVLLGAGYLQAAQGAHDKALPYFQQSLALDPKFEPALVALFSSLVWTGRTERALEVATGRLAETRDPEWSWALAGALAAQGEWPQAATKLAECVQLFPTDPACRTTLTLHRWTEATPEAALGQLRRGLGEPSESEEPPRRLLTRIYPRIAAGQVRLALRELGALGEHPAERRPELGLGPDGTPDGWLRIRGELLLYARGDREGAAQVAERLATLRIGEALSLLGEVQDEGRLNALVDRRPFLKPFKWHQAFAAAHARRSGTPAEKIAAQELVARIDGWHLAGLNGLAEELLEQRKPAEALVALRKLRRAWPEPGAAFLLLFARSFALEGRAQEQLGARAAALAAYDHFLGLWKDADADLPELINAKARVEALRGGQPLR